MTSPDGPMAEENQSILARIDSSLDTGGASDPLMGVQQLLGAFFMFGAFDAITETFANAGEINANLEAGNFEIIGGNGPENGVFAPAIQEAQMALQPAAPAPAAAPQVSTTPDMTGPA